MSRKVLEQLVERETRERVFQNPGRQKVFARNLIRLVAGQLPVMDAVRLIGSRPQSFAPVRFVVGVVAFEPDYFAVAFKCQNMCCNSIQKPAIVTDHHRAARKIFESFFQGAHRIHIQIVGRLVQQQYIGAGL